MSPCAKIAACACLLAFIAGCASVPLREGGLAVGKDTTIGIEDLGVASINRDF